MKETLELHFEGMAEDGDPMDVMVFCQEPVVPMALIRVLPCYQLNADGLFIKALNEPSSNPKGIESISPATWNVARVGPIPRGTTLGQGI